MKINITTPTKLVITTAVACLAIFSTVKGQSAACDETTTAVQNQPAPELSVITEDDYPNLLTLTGLKKYSNVLYPDNLKKNNEYQVKGYGKRASLYALYNKEGNLIEANYVVKNSRLPSAIYQNLVTGNYRGWTMINNKKTVRDFDSMKTEYEVEIQRDKIRQTLYFDYAGNPISRLAKN